MTREEFEHRYTNGNAETLKMLRQRHRYAIPCDCGEPTCDGWQMASLLNGMPKDVAQIVHDYPEVAERLDPTTAEEYKLAARLYNLAAEINEKYNAQRLSPF